MFSFLHVNAASGLTLWMQAARMTREVGQLKSVEHHDAHVTESPS
jgi:hypothetical protein